MRLLRALLIALSFWGVAAASAHEVRPASLEITQRADDRVDVAWKQPKQGELTVHLRPLVSGGLLSRAPDATEVTSAYAVMRWRGLPLKRQGLDGREVQIEGLDRTITDVLLMVHLADGTDSSQVLTPTAPSYRIDTHAGIFVWGYLRLGIEHILTGVDHLLFVFGLMLLSDGVRRLLTTVTAFTVAHSITLAATALRLISIDPQLVEAMVAFSIVFLGLELVRKYRGEGGLALRHPWLIAFSFGLLHGAAFAGALKEVGLPPGNVPAALFLFNVGVEIGQLAFVTVAGGLIWALARLRWRPAFVVAARIAVAYAIGGFATYWFLDRLHTALVAV